MSTLIDIGLYRLADSEIYVGQRLRQMSSAWNIKHVERPKYETDLGLTNRITFGRSPRLLKVAGNIYEGPLQATLAGRSPHL